MKLSYILSVLQKSDDLKSRKNAAHVIKHVYSAYGKVTSHQSIKDIIKETDEHSYELLTLLVEYKLFTYQNIKSLVKKLDQAYTKKHSLTHISVNEKFINKTEENRKNTQITTNNLMGLTIHQDDKIYKRELHSDVKKLLNQ